jgi:hypothetical protein
MAEYLEARSVLGIKKEATYGTDPTLAAADLIEHNEGVAIPTYNPEMQDRAVIRDTFSTLAQVRGAELNAEGTLNFELHGSGTPATPPETDPLWEAAIGVGNSSTASAVASATSATEFTVTATEGSNFAVGDAVLIDPAGGGGTAYEVAWITVIATDTLTVSPALSATPAVAAAVGAGYHYKLNKAELESFYLKYWKQNPDGSEYVRTGAAGCKISQLAMSMATGEIIVPAFNFMAKNTLVPNDSSDAVPTGPSYDTTDPLVATLMVVTIGGVTYDVSDVAFEINNELFKRTAVTTSGITKVIRTKRQVQGSFSLLYENKTIEDALRADTRAELVLVAGSAAGNMFAVRFPTIRYIETPVTVDSRLFKYDVSFVCEPDTSDAMGGGYDNEIYSASWL